MAASGNWCLVTFLEKRVRDRWFREEFGAFLATGFVFMWRLKNMRRDLLDQTKGPFSPLVLTVASQVPKGSPQAGHEGNLSNKDLMPCMLEIIICSHHDWFPFIGLNHF